MKRLVAWSVIGLFILASVFAVYDFVSWSFDSTDVIKDTILSIVIVATSALLLLWAFATVLEEST